MPPRRAWAEHRRRAPARDRGWDPVGAQSGGSSLLLLEGFEEVVQRIETALPMGALRRKPILRGPQRRRREGVGAHAALLLRAHEAAILQNLQVLDEGR